MSGRAGRWAGGALVVAALVVALWVRLWGLGVSASRTDEINFWRAGMGNPGQGRWAQLCELWRNPPWFNQMPTGDSIPMVWCGLRGVQGPGIGIGEVRRPFALLGWLGVAAVAAWLWRRRGWTAAWLGAVWLGLLPLHAYHSREAYYYAPMLFAAGLAMPWAAGTAADAARGLARAGKGWNLALGAALMLGLCMTHMGAWAPAAVAWAMVGVMLWRGTGTEETRVLRRPWMGWWTGMSVVIALGMSRWIARVLVEVTQRANDEGLFIGSDAGWVLSHVLAFFCGGGHWMGWAVLAGAVATAVVAWWLLRRKNRFPLSGKGGETGFHCLEKGGKQVSIEWKHVFLGEGGDVLYEVTLRMAVATFLGSMAFVMSVGGGLAKMAYLMGSLPLLAAWGAMSGERLGRALGGGVRGAGACVALGLALGAAFWGMTREAMRLEGRPTPYVALQEWLGNNLPAGDTAIVDRWLEPWNEMALYAPTNDVHVSFTIPDEPYENYVRGHWRDVTRQVFEEGGAQAFVRLTRNHEQRMGLWTWPEHFFRHRAVVTNEVGLKMLRNGSAPMEDFYDYPSRLEVEVFYDLRDDTAAKQFARGAKAWVSFGAGWAVFKPWQQGDWTDYHILRGGETGMLEIRNPASEVVPVTLEVTATAIGGKVVCLAGRLAQLTFEPGLTAIQTFDFRLRPGVTELPFRITHSGEGAWIAVSAIRVK